MSYGMDYPLSAAESPASIRAAFIRNTYAHVAGAILAFAGLEYVLLQLPGIDQVAGLMLSGYMWLIVMVGFIGANYAANRMAMSSTSPAVQYLGLAICVIAWAVIFIPLLYIASTDLRFKGVIPSAGIMTLAVFGGLTGAVLLTRKDFSFLQPILSIVSMLALGLIVISIFVGFNLGIFFMFAMVALACGYILYDTSNVLYRYQPTQHVAAAVALFSDVALLFWYILQIFMSERR